MADGDDVASWLGRGEAFLRMGVPALADLHFAQARDVLRDEMTDKGRGIAAAKAAVAKEGEVVVEEEHGLAAELTRLQAELDEEGLAPGKGLNPGSAKEGVPPIPTTARDALDLAITSAKEGMVVFQERFFRTSGGKFELALAALDRAHALTLAPGDGPVLLGAKGEAFGDGGGGQKAAARAGNEEGELMGAAGEAASLRGLRRSCHLNLAACHLLRQRDYYAAVKHCDAALATLAGHLGAENAEDRAERRKALLRRAEALGKIGRFGDAAMDLRAVLAALDGERDSGDGDRSEARAEVAAKLERLLYTETQFASLDSE